MTIDSSENPESSPETAPEAASAAPTAAPKRARTRKAPAVAGSVAPAVEPAIEIAQAATVADVPVQAEAETKPIQPAPKPRTRKPAAASLVEIPAPVVPEMGGNPIGVVEAAPPALSPEPTPPIAVPSVPALPGAEVDPGAAAEADASAEVSDRSRSRRRGRRGGSRGPELEAEGRAVGDRQASDVPAEVKAEPEMASGSLPPDAGELFASLVSGEFDAASEMEADSVTDPATEKRVLLPDPDAPKLHKVLAQSGIGSRRDMEQMILEGRVSVNGEVAHTGMRISFGDRIQIDGKPVRVRIAPPPARVIAYHKPVGEVVSHDDPQQRPSVFRKLPRLPHGKWQSVGRLDINTEGLLLFTTSGDLANKLMHPRFGVEREYAVRVLGNLEAEARERLLAGVDIEGQAAAFTSIEDGGGEGANRWFRVVISEGRNREVRKLFAAVGLTVSRLIRVRYGCVVLPRGLRRGDCADLSETDVRALRQLTGVPSQEKGGGRSAGGRGEGQSERVVQERGDRPPRGDSPRPEGRRGEAPREFVNGPGRNEEARGEPRGERGSDRRPPRPQQASAAPGANTSRRSGPPDRQAPPRGRAAPGRERDAGDLAPQELREPGDPSRIPNPLQQTFDRRAIQRERAVVRDDDFEDGPIPNPLQQTYDKRFGQSTGKSGGGRSDKGAKSGGVPKQPDPMQTSVGYLGGDAFVRKMQGKGGRRGGR